MERLPYFIAIFIALISCNESKVKKSNLNKNATYQLVWADEFDKDGLPDNQKWTFDYGDGCPSICEWGNEEKQFYTKRLKNARVEDGKLIIETHKEKFEESEYTSSRIATNQKGDWKYGKFEIRAKLPSGLGVWPAIWMLPTDWEYGGWPKSGEIDIMEHVGHVQDSIYGTIHTKAYNHSIGTHIGQPTFVENPANEFHNYSIEWTENSIKWFVDEVQYFEVENEQKTFAEWPFDKRFHLVLNIAVGGFWGGEKGIDNNIFPQKMMIDYVRVYQK
jgi:beta-glucanase (GH16 family)